ncbi:MAG: 5-formyltetrahydrofolate cyclo-ligase [Oscillospiraceae bacterium]|nr:5-formyltetrahydrofolate cyclo-ligase [Oscillospiraceae bacterium]
MKNAIMEEKAALRQEILAARAAMPFDQRKAADAAITEAVLELPAFKAAKQILCYVSMPHEISTKALLDAILRSGKTLGLPVCNTVNHEMQFYRLDAVSELQTGAYRIPVPPVSEDRILLPDAETVMIVPLLAFDAAGRRLGAGGGYYDRYLAKYPVKAVGICYADCRRAQLPHDAFDIKMNCCVTEQKTEEF